MIRFIFVAFIMTLWCSNTRAEGQEPLLIQGGFISGVDYFEMNPEHQTSYLIGVIDGLFLSPFLKAPSTQSEQLKTCLIGMQDIQIKTIIEKYFDASPERWHQSMHTIVWTALNELCFEDS